MIELGFSESLTEIDIWMRRVDDHYEYIVRYANDLAITSRSPSHITDALEGQFGLKLKGTGPIG